MYWMYGYPNLIMGVTWNATLGAKAANRRYVSFL